MANYQSTQAAKIANQKLGQDNMLQTNELDGRVRHMFFQYTTPAGGLLQNDTVELNDLPIGARVIGGKLITGALGAGVTASIGPDTSYGNAGSTTKYANAIDVSALGTSDIAHTAALNQGFLTITREHLVLTLGGAAPAGAKLIQGYINYVVD